MMKRPGRLGAAAVAVLALTAVRLQFIGQLGGRLERAAAASEHGGRATAAARQLVGTPQEGHRHPVRVRHDQRRDRPGDLPGGAAGRDRRRRLRQQLHGRHQRAPDQVDSCIGDGHPPPRPAAPTSSWTSTRSRSSARPTSAGPPRSRSTQHANLAYLGGIPFTPVPETAPNSIQFWSVSVGDNAAAAVYAGKTLGVKSAASSTSATPRARRSLPQITPVFKAAGVTKVKNIPLSPTSPDPSPAGGPGSRAAALSSPTSTSRTAAATCSRR